MEEKLIVPGHIADFKYVIPAIKAYADANDWISTSEYIDREFEILKSNKVETEKKKDLTDYTKDAELPRYFGFIERQIKGDVKSDCRITASGKRFYQAYLDKNKDLYWEEIMLALENVTFGRNNDGCPNSNTKLEAPNILMISSLLLDGITRVEYASVLYQMLSNRKSIISAIMHVKLSRTSGELGNTVRVDNKVIPFLISLGFLNNGLEGKIIIPDEVKVKYQKRISELKATNDEGKPTSSNVIQANTCSLNQLEQTNVFSIFRPFVTAIKSKPFLLLAGISGTGKSRIVRELARACWEEDSEEYKVQKPRNFEMVQVKPNWHDSSELIGYVSRIDGVRYVVGPFLRFMVKAIRDPNTPYFLCLDEMNLAPVEQYFAEYLSVVESRKKQDDGTIMTDPIIDYSNTDEYVSLIHQLFPDDDDLRKEYQTEEGGKRLTIPNNLIVVGTVNMDETTFSFSRKVLDRAMTIEMNEVDLKGGLDSRHEKIGKLGASELIGTAVEGVDVYSTYKEVCDTAIAYLQNINNVLEGTPFKIAYRTRNEVLLYVVNNLPYNKDEDGNIIDEKYVIARALDEITNMKILSRIEGDESKVSKDFLDTLETTIHDGLETVFSEIFDEKEDDVYTSVSLAKIEEMKKRLDSGYTSFWS